MKDDAIRIRISKKDKAKIKRDAKRKGFSDVSSYLLTLAGIRELPQLSE